MEDKAANEAELSRSSSGLRGLLDTALWAFRLSWSTNSFLTIGLVVPALVSAVIPAGLALVGRGLVNSLVELVSGGVGDIAGVLPWLALGLALTIVEAISSALNRFFDRRLYDELENRVAMITLRHAAELEVAFFEDQHGQDVMALAQSGAARYCLQFTRNWLLIVTSIIQAVSLIGVLIVIEPIITLVLVPLALPYLVVQWRLTRARYETEYTRSTKRRWVRYFTSHMTTDKWVPETKLLGLAPLLIDQCDDLLTEFRDQNRLLYRRGMINDLLFVVSSTVALYAVLARVVSRVLEGLLTVGDVAIYSGATARLRRTLQGIVTSASAVREGMLYISNLREFLAVEPEMAKVAGAKPSPVAGTIEVEGVSFTYPGTRTSVLDDVSFRIEPGETVALVGENGAGKTTLAKLMARLYDPTVGRILFGGMDLRELSLEDWRSRVGFVFQFFGMYEATASDNIAFGDWERLLHDLEETERVARRANVHDLIESLPEGYDTLLGRMFGTYTLSRGQWQRIAIARAFARQDAALMILDEPTSNMDARAEYDLFKRFRELSAGRATILISHRFSTVSIADRILVLDKGRIIEQGTHNELVSKQGHYAALYRLHQSQMTNSSPEGASLD